MADTPNLNLGQHFVIDKSVVAKMTENITRGDRVLEIGAGNGILTELLAKKARQVTAIEIDNKFSVTLKSLQKKYKNLHIIIGNALDEDFGKFDFLIANLPYHIIEPLMNKTIKYKNLKMRLMIGDKFASTAQVSGPSDPNFTELSLLCNSFYEIREVAKVPKTAFDPQPRTDSIILDFAQKDVDFSKNPSIFIAQRLFISQTKGSKIKNFLMNGLITIKPNLTKNEARKIIDGLSLDPQILERSFSQLNNEQIRSLSEALQKITFCERDSRKLVSLSKSEF